MLLLLCFEVRPGELGRLVKYIYLVGGRCSGGATAPAYNITVVVSTLCAVLATLGIDLASIGLLLRVQVLIRIRRLQLFDISFLMAGDESLPILLGD